MAGRLPAFVDLSGKADDEAAALLVMPLERIGSGAKALRAGVKEIVCRRKT
jgi:hypothetical protein